MADAVLFEFLHTEMVAELWAQDPDPDPGPGVSAGPGGTEDEPVGPGGHGLPRGPGHGREATPGDAGLQRGARCPQIPVQRPVGGRVSKADGQPPHQSSGDLRPTGQQLPLPHPDVLGPAVSGGSTQVPGLHLRPPAWRSQHPGHQEPGHCLRGSLASL
nr:PREDICTED: trafficking protein particle complex subunit 6A isoform X4 [Rhinolophus sinicus]